MENIGLEYYGLSIEKHSEKVVERKLVEKIKEKHGWAPKWVCPGIRGVPDRLIFMPGPRFIGLVETKSTGDKPSELQKHIHAKLRKMGFKVWVIDSVPGVLKFVENEV